MSENTKYPEDRFMSRGPDRAFGSASSTLHIFGMTMRQYYKAAALTGLLAAKTFNWEATPLNLVELPRQAAEYADAMLAEDRQHEQGE